jgi:hypothetical protein
MLNGKDIDEMTLQELEEEIKRLEPIVAAEYANPGPKSNYLIHLDDLRKQRDKLKG